MIETVPLLRGVRVLDFTWIAAGPSGTMMLALAGAEVIKIESRAKLDNYRKNFGQDGDVDRSILFASVNAGKRSITIDAKTAEGRAVILDMVARADVVVENFSPGAMARLGLGFDDLVQRNPGIVMVSSSAAGQSGPKRQYAGFASIFAAQGGLAAVARRPDGTPVRFSRSIDSRVGTAIAVATVAGLIEMRRTGQGCHLDVSGQEVVAALLGDIVSGSVASDPPGRCFECRDGWAFVERDGSKARVPPDEALAEVCSSRDRNDAVATLREMGVAAAAVPAVSELVPAKGVQLRHPWDESSHPLMGRVLTLGLPIRWPAALLSEEPARPVPRLGEHTDEVLSQVLPSSAPSVQAARVAGALR